MTRKQTSTKVSRIAGHYMSLGVDGVAALMAGFYNAPDKDVLRVAKDIVTLAASCLSQDEVKGPSPAQRRKKAKAAKEHVFTLEEVQKLARGEVVFKTEGD